MHWIDPAQLPVIHGTIERFLCNPHGELDGLALVDLGDASAELGDIEQVHSAIEEAALAALSSGGCVVLLGGGHDGAYASHSALLRATRGPVDKGGASGFSA